MMKDNRPVMWISLKNKSITWYNHTGKPSRVKKFKTKREMDAYIQKLWKEKIKK